MPFLLPTPPYHAAPLWTGRLPAVLAAGLVVIAGVAVAQAPAAEGGRGDRMEVRLHEDQYQLVWRDAEDVLEGAVLPARMEVGRPVTVSVRIRSFEAPPFDGPVTVTLRPVGAQHGPSVMVERQGERWLAEVTPEVAGTHVVSVGFWSSRHKVVHGEVPVHAAPLPRAVLWGLAVALVLGIVGFGASRVLRRNDAG